jgi:hypothetical protein
MKYLINLFAWLHVQRLCLEQKIKKQEWNEEREKQGSKKKELFESLNASQRLIDCAAYVWRKSWLSLCSFDIHMRHCIESRSECRARTAEDTSENWWSDTLQICCSAATAAFDQDGKGITCVYIQGIALIYIVRWKCVYPLGWIYVGVTVYTHTPMWLAPLNI